LLFSFEEEQYEVGQMSYEIFILIVNNKYLVFEFGAHTLTHHCHPKFCYIDFDFDFSCFFSATQQRPRVDPRTN